MEELNRKVILQLKKKGGSLAVSDASFIQNFIQEQTAPIFSLRTLCKSDSQATSASQFSPRLSVARNNTAHEKSDSNSQRLKGRTNEGLDITSLEDFPPMLLQEER